MVRTLPNAVPPQMQARRRRVPEASRDRGVACCAGDRRRARPASRIAINASSVRTALPGRSHQPRTPSSAIRAGCRERTQRVANGRRLRGAGGSGERIHAVFRDRPRRSRKSECQSHMPNAAHAPSARMSTPSARRCVHVVRRVARASARARAPAHARALHRARAATASVRRRRAATVRPPAPVRRRRILPARRPALRRCENR